MASQDNQLTDPKQIAEKFVAARRSHTGMTQFPGQLPDTMDEAYQIQAHAIKMWDDSIKAWKVGGVPPALQSKYNATRLAGPVFGSTIKYSEDGGHTDMPIFVDGFAAIEAEFILELGDVSDLPSSDLSEDQVRAAVSRVFIGVEIASSPLTIVNDVGPVGPASDFGNNHGLIVGPELKNWQDQDLSAFEVTVNINNEHMGTVSTQPGMNGPLGAVKFLIEHLKQNNYDIPKGTYVSTGAITGVHQAFVDATSSISFAGLGKITLKLVPSK